MNKKIIPLLVGLVFVVFLIPFVSASHSSWYISATNTVNQSGFVASGSNTTINITLNITVVNNTANFTRFNITSLNNTGWNFTGSGPYNASAIGGCTYGGGTMGGTITSINCTNGTAPATRSLIANGTNATIWFTIGMNATVEGIYSFVINLSSNLSESGQHVGNTSNFTVELDTTAPTESFSTPTNNSEIDKDFTMNITTDETAECRYSINPSVAYGSMTLFSATNATSHTFTFSGDASKAYDYYFKCMDDNNPRQNTNSDDTYLRFTTRGTGGGGGGGGGNGIVSGIAKQEQQPAIQRLQAVQEKQAQQPKRPEGVTQMLQQKFTDIIDKIKNIWDNLLGKFLK